MTLSRTSSGIGQRELAHARAVVRRHLSPTPLVRYHHAPAEVPVYLKLESMQPGGSFKVRGALSAAAAYAAQGEPIVTASAGNHALGIAYAAEALGVEATVVVPRTGSPAKIAALSGRGIRLVLEGADYDEAEAVALDLAKAGARYVSAYNDPYVIAGQSTVVTELDEQVPCENAPNAYTVAMGVGGGGLMAGIAIGAADSARDVTVVGVETDQCRPVSTAVAAGRVVEVPVGDTIADGLLGNIEPDCITPRIAAETGVSFVVVDETAIRQAVVELALSAGVVAEGSAAVALAALRRGVLTATQPIVLVVSGRNIAAPLLSALIGDS
jgi:threonine dehydratase